MTAPSCVPQRCGSRNGGRPNARPRPSVPERSPSRPVATIRYGHAHRRLLALVVGLVVASSGIAPRQLPAGDDRRHRGGSGLDDCGHRGSSAVGAASSGARPAPGRRPARLHRTGSGAEPAASEAAADQSAEAGRCPDTEADARRDRQPAAPPKPTPSPTPKPATGTRLALGVWSRATVEPELHSARLRTRSAATRTCT